MTSQKTPAAPVKTIKVCSGIGDTLWLIQKLLSTGEKYRFLICNRGPQRGHQIFECFPDLVHSHEYADFSTEDCEGNTISKTTRRFADITQQEFYLSINKHLEHGHRIEKFYPELETHFELHPTTGSEYEHMADAIMRKSSKPTIMIYTSAYGSTRNWNFWDENGWLELAQTLGKDYRYLIIGADFDTDLGRNTERLLKRNGFTVDALFGKPLKLIIELMKRVVYFYAFPSGMPILSTLIGTPTLMFYPPHLHNMKGAWAPPAMLASGTHLPVDFITPVQTVQISALALKAAKEKKGFTG